MILIVPLERRAIAFHAKIMGQPQVSDRRQKEVRGLYWDLSGKQELASLDNLDKF